MKTDIINVIEVIDNTVTSVESFILPNSKMKAYKKVIEDAENLFIEKAKENEMSDDESEGALDDGYYKNGDYTVYLSWSSNVFKFDK